MKPGDWVTAHVRGACGWPLFQAKVSEVLDDGSVVLGRTVFRRAGDTGLTPGTYRPCTPAELAEIERAEGTG